MEKSTVVVCPCEDYNEETVYRAVADGIAAVGGIGAFVRAEERILVKPNFLYPSEPERCVTTHPAVIRAVCRVLSEGGMKSVTVGDSPANGTSRAAAAKLGLTEENLFGAAIADMNEERTVEFPEGKTAIRFRFAREVTEADAIIGVCKMKTHALERVTGAVKNMYGLVCGYRKAVGHTVYTTPVRFANMLSDIFRATPQRLHIMDGVTAMEGNGPASGTPRKMGVILISADPVALDSVFCSLIHLSPELVPTNVRGELAGIGTCRRENIRLLLSENGSAAETDFESLEKRFGCPDFDADRGEKQHSLLALWGRITGSSRRPVIDEKKCVRCGVCVAHCPVEGGAVTFRNGRDRTPVYDYRKCIRCYCCQELCPKQAISVKKR